MFNKHTEIYTQRERERKRERRQRGGKRDTVKQRQLHRDRERKTAERKNLGEM